MRIPPMGIGSGEVELNEMEEAAPDLDPFFICVINKGK
jgi:hypothetical protein